MNTKRHYYQVNLNDPEDESTGSSYCVSCDSELTDEEATEAVVKLELTDRETLEEYNVIVEDITDDPDTLKWFLPIAAHYTK